MPFQKGNQLAKGHGRKGLQYEAEQNKMMIQVINEYLCIVLRILKTGGNNADYAKLTTVGADARKILDKLHASKTESKIEDSTPRLTQNIVVLLDKIYGRKRIIRNVDEGSERPRLPSGSV